MTYYKNSIEYHNDLDRFEAHTRAEQAEREFQEVPHPVDEAYRIEQEIDSILDTGTKVQFNPEMNSGVRYPLVENTSDDNWDFTPFPKNMPDIDFDKIDEIPF